MTDHFDDDPPSPLVVEWARASATAAPAVGRALDVAAGHGRHAVALAQLGWRVFAVDVNAEALRMLRERVAMRGLVAQAWCADLTQAPLPPAAFDLVVVTRYLDRNLFASIRETVTPGGLVVYETFTVHQRALGVGPTSPDHLLQVGELRARFDGFDVLFSEEVRTPQAVARVVARRP